MNPIKCVSELKATDWILARWAVSIGDGLFGIPWDEVPQSKVLPLSDQCAIVVDQLIIRSGDKTKRLVGYWYRTPLPKTEIARKIGVDRDTIYVQWNAALWYFRERFLSSPLSELRFIAATDVADYLAAPKKVAMQPTLDVNKRAECGYCLNGPRAA